MALSIRFALVALQVVQVLFLALHDWVQIGRLNNTAAALAADGRKKLLTTTVVSAAPYALGLVLTLAHIRDAVFPHGVRTYLLVSYGILFLGQMIAWWIPYLVRPDPVRAKRYRVLFAGTTTLLPERNGISPNVLHIFGLHLETLATLLLLVVSS